MPRRFLQLLLSAALAAGARGLVCPPPCGPFCPMRSKACVAPSLDPRLEVLGASAPLISEQLNALTTELDEGDGAPIADFAERCRKLGSDLRALRADYEDVQKTLGESDDFQAQEYCAFMLAARERRGGGLRAAETDAIVDFQVGMLEAIATGGRPPPPPAGVELKALEQMDGSEALLVAPAGARVTTPPVRREAATTLSDALGGALAGLLGEHAGLIEFGGSYGAFDRGGKTAFLDQVESLGERWGTFLERHGGALASADLLDATYLEQTDAFLKGVGLESIEEFVVVLDDAHGRMRADADRAP